MPQKPRIPRGREPRCNLMDSRSTMLWSSGLGSVGGQTRQQKEHRTSAVVRRHAVGTTRVRNLQDRGTRSQTH